MGDTSSCPTMQTTSTNSFRPEYYDLIDAYDAEFDSIDLKPVSDLDVAYAGGNALIVWKKKVSGLLKRTPSVADYRTFLDMMRSAGDVARDRFIRTWILRQLQAYESYFKHPSAAPCLASGINLHFHWITSWIGYYTTHYENLFASEWNVLERTVYSLCVTVKDAILDVIEKNKASLTSETIVSVLKRSWTLELAVTEFLQFYQPNNPAFSVLNIDMPRQPDRRNESVVAVPISNPTRQDVISAKFEGIISRHLEPFMRLFLAHQESVLEAAYAKAIENESWRLSFESVHKPVFSAVAILDECGIIFNTHLLLQQPLIPLADIVKRVLNNYCKWLTQKLLHLESTIRVTSSRNEKATFRLLISTAIYCAQRIIRIQQILQDQTSAEYAKSNLWFGAEYDAFNHFASKVSLLLERTRGEEHHVLAETVPASESLL